jgi:lisH domain-containing protein FOPNL
MTRELAQQIDTCSWCLHAVLLDPIIDFHTDPFRTSIDASRLLPIATMANLNELKDGTTTNAVARRGAGVRLLCSCSPFIGPVFVPALLHTLAAKGSLGQIKARIRSEIFSALDSTDDTAPKAPLSNTNLLINELIREYLQFNQYRYSLNVFLPESNQPEVPPFDRSFISKELHVQENQHSVQMSVIDGLRMNGAGVAVHCEGFRG